MTMLVSLEVASSHLRRDTTADDPDLELKIKAASKAVVTYLKTPSFADSNGDIPEDSNGIALDVPEDVQVATLLLIGEYYRQRDANAGQTGLVNEQYGYGYLPQAVIGLLYPYRVPTIA